MTARSFKEKPFKAILINLDRDTARLDHMRRELARAGIVFTRLPGILGDQVPPDLKPRFFDASGQKKVRMKRGEIGCYASHLRALGRVASGEYGDRVLIMEDDLTIAPDFLDSVGKAVAAMPAGWDILRLSSVPRRAYAPVAALGADRLLVRYSKIPNSAGAYLVTPAGARKFLDKGVRGLTFDDDLRRPWFHGMNTFGIVPPPMQAGALASSIDAIEPGRFDKGVSSRMERILRGDHIHAARRAAYNMRALGVGPWLACGAINLADMLARPLVGGSIVHRAARLFPSAR